MTAFDSTFLDLGRLDDLSYNDTIIHRIDPRAKLIVTVAFILAVVSVPKYALTSLVPFFFFPMLMTYLAPVVPFTTELASEFLGVSLERWSDLDQPLLGKTECTRASGCHPTDALQTPAEIPQGAAARVRPLLPRRAGRLFQGLCLPEGVKKI